jgi:dipeptidyl aminopeptidase/acylaminoacyl peptidase
MGFKLQLARRLIVTLAAVTSVSTLAKTAQPKGGSGYKGYGDESVSPETLAKFAPQELPKDVQSRVQKYLDIRSAGAGIPSPDGKNIYMSWNVTGTVQTWKLDGPLNFPVQLTAGEDSTRPLAVTPDGKWLVVSRDEGGREAPGLWLIDAARGGELREVYKKDKVVTNLQFITADSRWLYYAANDIKPDSYAIWRWEIATGKKELVFSEDGIWGVLDHQSDGRLLLTKVKGNFAQEIFEFNPADKKLTPVIGQGEAVSWSARYGAKAGTYIVSTDKIGEFSAVYELKDGKLTRIIPEMNADVVGFEMDQPRSKILYMTNEGGFTRLYAMDAKTYKPIRLPEFKDAYHVYVADISPNGRWMTLAVEGADRPRSGYMYDFKRGKLEQWTRPSTPEVDTTTFARANLEYYPARDGTKIPMIVRRPVKCAEPCPVIVSFHGGPEAQSQPGFDLYAQLFVDAGFIYAEPNVRGSTGYGKTWRDADNAAKRLDVLSDIEDAALFIRKNWAKDGVEPKVGITGGSYGGYATLIGMTLYAGAYDAGVSSVGISNLVTFLENTAPYRRALRAAEYGDLEKDREALIKLSPINHIDRIKGPLFVIQGANDPRVPVGEAVQMYEAMVKKNVKAKLMIFADEGHGSAKRSNRVLEVGHALAFFKEHLQKEADKKLN